MRRARRRDPRRRACTRGGSGAATSPSTAWSPRRAALDDAGLAWRDIQYVAGADTIRNGYPGFVAGVDVRAEARLDGRARVVELRGVRVGRARRCSRRGRRSWPGSATSPSWSAPTPHRRASSPRSAASARPTPTGCASTCSAQPTPSTSRCTRAGAWTCTARRIDDFAQVKVKNSTHGLREPERALPQGEHDRRRRSSRPSSPIPSACSTSAPPPTARRR